jgi:hypothetical protein
VSDAYERAVELYRADHLTGMRDLFFRLALNRLPLSLLQDLIAVMENEDTAALREALGAGAGAAVSLDRAAVDKALRQVITHADYDLHKSLEGDESGEDTYAEHVDRFIAEYGKSAPATDVQVGYDAVYEVIRNRQLSERPSVIQVNALMWRAVHAFIEAMGIESRPELKMDGSGS